MAAAYLNKLKESFQVRYADNPLKTLFYTIILASVIIVMLIGGLITFGKCIEQMFLGASIDLGGDFFNPLREDMSMSADIYPPFTYFLYLFLGKLIPFEGGEALRETVPGLTVYIVYMLIVYILLYKAMKKMKIGTEREKNFFFILMLLTLPSIFLIERSNILALVLVFVLLFFNGYNSENKKVRYIAYLCLAVATGLKLYPAVFGLLLLRTKNAKEIGICVLMCLIVFFVPFLFVDGTVSQFFDNIFSYTSSMSIAPHGDHIDMDNLFACLYAISGSTLSQFASLVMGALLVLAGISVVLSARADKWKLAALTILATLLFTGFKPVYAIMFMVIPLMMFIDSRPAMNKLNFAYMVCFVLMFMPMFEIFFDLEGSIVPISTLIEAIALLVMFILLLCETLPDAVRNTVVQIRARQAREATLSRQEKA